MKINWKTFKNVLLHRGPGYNYEMYDQFSEDALFIHRVLSLFANARVHDDLLWLPVTPTTMIFSANISDWFDWGGADSEAITPQTLIVLEGAYADLLRLEYLETGNLRYLAPLYAARIRQRRPLPATQTLPYPPRVQELFDACCVLEEDRG